MAKQSGIRTAERKRAMNVEYVISGLIALALLVYLAYALLKTEKF